MSENLELEEEIVYFSRELGRLSDKLSNDDLARIIVETLGVERVGEIINVLLKNNG